MASSPKIVVHSQVAKQPRVKAFPGGELFDFDAFPESKGTQVLGFYKDHGSEPEFSVTYPDDEFKYITEGELKVRQDGKEIIGRVGDVVYIPAGAHFTIIPSKFSAL
ncbi:hypothetical protein JCM10207_006852 [Rhodosporidiobolus poonsookiae]